MVQLEAVSSHPVISHLNVESTFPRLKHQEVAHLFREVFSASFVIILSIFNSQIPLHYLPSFRN